MTTMPRDSSKTAESESPGNIREDMFPCGTKSLIAHRKLSCGVKTVRREKGMQSLSRFISPMPTSTRRPPHMTCLPVCVSPIVAHIRIFVKIWDCPCMMMKRGNVI